MELDHSVECKSSKKKKSDVHRKKSAKCDHLEDDSVPDEVREAFRRRSKKQGGLHHFGLGKTGMTRAVVRFPRPPDRHPTSVCFHFPSTFLTHRFILDGVKEKIHFLSGAAVTSILFIERNVLLGSRGLDNRWVITLTSVEARDELMRVGLHLYNKRVVLRRYDDVLQEEYTDYQQFVCLQRRLYGDVMPDDGDKTSEEMAPSSEESSSQRKARKKRSQKKKNRKPDHSEDKNEDIPKQPDAGEDKEDGFTNEKTLLCHHINHP